MLSVNGIRVKPCPCNYIQAWGRRLGKAIEIDTARSIIIDAAAKCFMRAGFSATSIDDVAEYLGATKGRIYHYYRSKAELFFDVHRYGMALNVSAVEPLAKSGEIAEKRLAKMCNAHLRNMLDNIDYQRVVLQGVEMHLASSTTPKQRNKLKVLMKEREYYEGLFKDVLTAGRKEGVFRFDNPSFASKAVLAILNNPVLWYKPRKNQSEEEKLEIIDQFSTFAIQSVKVGQ